MLQEMSSKLLQELELGLERFTAQVSDPLERLVQSLKLIRDSLHKLKQLMETYPFDTNEEEIYFFKCIKPAFYCHQIYCTEMYTIETGFPFGDVSKQLVFLEGELTYLDRYFKKHAFLYQYYKLGASDLDSLYFVRGIVTQTILLPNIPELDPAFSTSCDHLFSKFKGIEMLKNTLLEKITEIKQGHNTIEEMPGELKWTGDKVNLAEIIYGIYFTGQINHGKIELSTLTKWMGKLFQIDLKRIYSDYRDIRNRKIASPTQYLDQMRKAMHQRIDDENAFKPQEMMPKKKF
ncbi:hypothetical protein AAKU52_003125 [Pedobacter sp. CG_S7]|uniref:RteC domain-containing protein n=1 Tax=Pedobacter sp. CG_S7 TaxID=3143930 RepID=UPI00339B3DEB